MKDVADVLLSFLDVLTARSWTADAACADAEDPDAFHEEGSRPGSAPALSSRTALACMELCGACRVRQACLAEACAVWSVSFPTAYGHGAQGIRRVRATGCWGGTWDVDRRKVRGLPLAEQIEALEAGLPMRLGRRRRAVAAAAERGEPADEAGDEATSA
jgi:hypothetical protein